MSEYLYDIDHRLVDQIVVSGTASLGYSRANIYAGGEYLGEDAPDSLVKTPSATASMLRITDQAGSLRSRWDLAGNMVTECTSFPYGEGYSCTGATPPTLYTGKDRDPETGFDFFGARYYNSSMGRFTSPDWSASVAPIPYVDLDDPQSLNLYTYVGNRPVSSVDPDGHTCSDGSTQCWLEEHAPLVAEAEKDIEKSWSGTVGKINKAAGKLTGIGEFNLKNSEDRSALANTLGSGFNNLMAVVVPAIASDGLSLEGELGAEAGAAAAQEEGLSGAETSPQLKILSRGDVDLLKENEIDPHDLKPNSKYDLFKDKKGDVFVKPKDGSGPGEPTGINLKDLRSGETN